MSEQTKYPYRVTGDHMRMVYSRHRTIEAARRAGLALARRWGHSHSGSEPQVERLGPSGWVPVEILSPWGSEEVTRG